MTKSRDYAEEVLRSLRRQVTCNWCKHPAKPIYRALLCRHCYDIRGRINRLRKKVEGCLQTNRGNGVGGSVPLDLDMEYRAALMMERSARAEGEMYGRLHTNDITGLDLEHEFSRLSGWLVRRDLYHGEANL